MIIVFGAQYVNQSTQEKVVFLGMTTSKVLLQPVGSDDFKKISHTEFQTNWVDTGIHNHKDFCCDIHNTHTSPHMGCIFR